MTNEPAERLCAYVMGGSVGDPGGTLSYCGLPLVMLRAAVWVHARNADGSLSMADHEAVPAAAAPVDMISGGQRIEAFNMTPDEAQEALKVLEEVAPVEALSVEQAREALYAAMAHVPLQHWRSAGWTAPPGDVADAAAFERAIRDDQHRLTANLNAPAYRRLAEQAATIADLRRQIDALTAAEGQA